MKATSPTEPQASREMALNALTIDFRSHIRDKDYRLLVSIPGKPIQSERASVPGGRLSTISPNGPGFARVALNTT